MTTTRGSWTPLWAIALVAAFLSGCLADAPAYPAPPRRWEAYLWNEPYDKLSIEVRYAPGFVPTKFALEALLETARDVTRKISVSLDEPRELGAWAGQERHWTWEDLVKVIETESALGSHRYGSGTEAVLEVYYVKGKAPLEDARGIEWDGRVFLFQDKTSARPHLGEGEERAILIHEFGHVIGLVDCGIPMIQSREEGVCHSAMPESVMAVEAQVLREGFARDLAGGSLKSWQFDEHDLEDIRSFQASFRSPTEIAGKRSG